MAGSFSGMSFSSEALYSDKDAEKTGASLGVTPYTTTTATSLHRGLKQRHISMIAIGGALGTGLVVGTGRALADAGPASLLIAYAAVGFVIFLVMCGLGEMAAYLPIESGFVGHAARFCDPSLGFALGYTYWIKYCVLLPTQLTAAALVIQYWCPPETVNPGIFIAVFLVLTTAINYFGGVESFGEFQFCLSTFKLLVILGIIILSAVLAAGGGPNHHATGFQYWNKPGAFRPFEVAGGIGCFLGVWKSMVNAVFAYLGTELIGVTAGEAQHPRRSIPKAIKLTFWRILIFYVLSVFLLGLILPYNTKLLRFGKGEHDVSASASPFVAAFRLAGIEALPGILNGCFLLFILSAANSDSYTATRTIFSVAQEGNAPAFLARTNRQKVPHWALLTSSLFGLMAFMNLTDDSATVFNYLVSLVSTFGLLTWITIVVSHICFIKARRAQGIQDQTLAYTSPFGLWGSYIAAAFCTLVVFTKDFEVFFGGFDYVSFITGYLALPLFIALLVGHKMVKHTRLIKPQEADLTSDKAAIDEEEQRFIATQGEPNKYYKLVSWLF